MSGSTRKGSKICLCSTHTMGRAVTDEARWRKIREDLEAVLSGKVKIDALVASRRTADSIASWKTPEVPTELKIDNNVSRDFTVVEVITEEIGRAHV